MAQPWAYRTRSPRDRLRRDRNVADGGRGAAMSAAGGYLRPAIAGSGQIACGLAAVASSVGEVRLLARSDASAWRAEEAAERPCGKLGGGGGRRGKGSNPPE